MLKYIFLGLIQGITEFLPVSSSGHLVLAKEFIDLPQDLTLDVVLHFATLLAVVFYYRKKIIDILNSLYSDFQKCREQACLFPTWNMLSLNSKVALYIILASIPAAVFGIFFEDFFDSIRNPLIVAVMFVVVALYMLFAHFKVVNADLRSLRWDKTLLIGIAQSLALIPGTSRSGVTISTGVLLGIKKQDAADFSFLLSIPVILGAFIFKMSDIPSLSYLFNINIIVGFFTALVSGYFSIKFLLNILQKYGFLPFVIYRILLAIILFMLYI